VLRLGQSYLGAARLPRLVQPFIQRVSMQSGETVNVSVLDGHEVVYVARSNSPRLVSIGFQVGARAPAHVVTPGVVMLSTLDDDTLDTWIAEHEFSVFTPQGVADPKRFRNDVLAARAQGFGITERQLEPSLRGIAVALKDRRGRCVGAVSITLPAEPLGREALIEKMLPLLADAAQALRPIL
jgi:IclR family pca regulon transcriptional regulator